MILLGDRLFSSMTLILYFFQNEKLQRKLRGEVGKILSENSDAGICSRSAPVMFRAPSCAKLSPRRMASDLTFGLTAEITKIQGGQ